MLYCYYNVDIIIFIQGWDFLDKWIWQIIDCVYYVYKIFIMGLFYIWYYWIFYGIIILDFKWDKGFIKFGEIIQGYCKFNLMVCLFFY